jgi:uncharacterized protein YjbI with pentapeptide repeats
MDIKTIGNKIVNARKAINMSQAQLAQQLFISPQAVGKWERGESVPDIVTMNRLAEILAVDLNYFSQFPSANDAQGTPVPVIRPTNVNEEDITEPSRRQELNTNFNGSNLVKSDFAGVKAHKRIFHGCAMTDANFAGADLTGSSFTGSNLQNAHFDGANLTDCTFSAVDLSGASFSKAILQKTVVKTSGMDGTTFDSTEFSQAVLDKTDLRKVVFRQCSFENCDFKYCDLREACLDGQTFKGVKFQNTALNQASFKGATLQDVSFHAAFAITNKFYKAISTICFDGATIDKLTYATLKSFGADLSKVTTL